MVRMRGKRGARHGMAQPRRIRRQGFPRKILLFFFSFLAVVSLQSFLLISVVYCREIHVGPGGLKNALARIHPHDHLVLAKGVYEGPVTLRKPCSLAGEPGAVLEGNRRGFTLVVAANGTEVSNLTFQGSGGDLSTDDAVILLKNVRGVTVRNCRVQAEAFGIYILKGGGNSILDNEVTGDASRTTNQRGNGIHLWYTKGNIIQGNTLKDVRDGIYLSFADENLIEGNRGSHLRFGIHYMYSQKNHLKNNVFDDGSGGIVLMFSRGNLVEGNETDRNRLFGMVCFSVEDSILRGNRASFNARGLTLLNSLNNQFQGNRIWDNGIGLFLAGGSEENMFVGNGIERNLVQVYKLRSGGNRWSQNGKGNYWSDYTGVDWDGNGIGDSPYQLERAASALMARRPMARWFWMSPALTLLNWWESRIQGPRESDIDPFPLMRPFGGKI